MFVSYRLPCFRHSSQRRVHENNSLKIKNCVSNKNNAGARCRVRAYSLPQGGKPLHSLSCIHLAIFVRTTMT
jgi:hypothetical protein